MDHVDKSPGSRQHRISEEPFVARIIFECNLVPNNKECVKAAVESFIQKFPNHVVENPRVTQASDGNVIQLTLICYDQEQLMSLNRELEMTARQFGLR